MRKPKQPSPSTVAADQPTPDQKGCEGVVRPIPGSEYVILPDQTVARRLKPMPLFRSIYFNIWLSGRYCRVNAKDLPDIADGKIDPRIASRRKNPDANQGR